MKSSNQLNPSKETVPFYQNHQEVNYVEEVIRASFRLLVQFSPACFSSEDNLLSMAFEK
jgi:hypothetical protein